MPDSPPKYGFAIGFEGRTYGQPIPLIGMTQNFLNSERGELYQTQISSEENTSEQQSHWNLPSNYFGGSWQHCTAGGPYPPSMVRAGVDADNDIIYVGRAFHNGNMLPAKVIPAKNMAFISFDGEEVPKDDFEVLRQGAFVWEFATNGQVPEGAIDIGMTDDGEKLYTGRALHCGTQTPGKVHPSHGCLYIPFDGAEVSLEEYEVLCIK